MAKPRDIDDDRGRRPALSMSEWQTSKAPAPTVTGTARPRKAAKAPAAKKAAPRKAAKKAGYLPRHAAAEVVADPKPGVPRRPRKAAKAAGVTADNVRTIEPKTPPLPVSGPASSVPGPMGRLSRSRVNRDAAMDQATQYANRQAYMAAHGKPSVVGRAAGGAAGGAAAGAAVGGPVGAGVGAALGGIGGGVGGARAKKQYRLATRRPNPARRVLVMEFTVCVVVAALAPLAEKNRGEPAGAWMKRMAALLGLFFVLGLISAAGRGAAKVAAGFGGIVAVVLVVSNRDVFTQITKAMNKADRPDRTTSRPGPESRTILTDLGNTQVDPTGDGTPKAFARRVT